MLLHSEYIRGTYMKESIGLTGQREVVLQVMLDKAPDSIRKAAPKQYDELSNRLNYLDTLAKNGFLDFDRIEISSDRDTTH